MRPCSVGARAFGVAIVALASLCGEVRAASKLSVALLGDPAPGGGVFAGPGFTGWPSAAGNGWVAFRGLVSGGSTNEALVVARMAVPVTRTQVASIGEPAPGGGTFRQFVGRPVVNANGDVAFVAQVTLAAGESDDPSISTPAGLFLFHANGLTAIAKSAERTTAGKIDLLGSVDPADDPNAVTERSPALNNAGDVAFLAAIREDPHSSGAIFLARLGQGPDPVVRIGDRFDGGTFSTLGPPALNVNRLLAFHAMVATNDEPSGGTKDGSLDGIFTAGPDAAPVALMAKEGNPVMPLDEPLQVFGDDVSLNDAGSAVFLAGPLHNDPTLAPTLNDSPGVVGCTAGVLTAIAYPGQPAGPNRITSFRLSPSEGSTVAPPAIAADGHVVFLASLDGGGREAIVTWDGSEYRFIYTGGDGPDPTAAGGFYAGASSAPTLDAVGGVAFRARIAGGITSEALVYQPKGAPAVVTVVGDSTPDAGFFAGKPFSTPAMNDAGDVVFRAFVARGDASVGIFRQHEGKLDAIVRSGDTAPGSDGRTFLDIVGQPSLNQLGAVAFAGEIAGRGLGIYVADQSGLRRIMATGDFAPDPNDGKFKSVAINPVLNDAGMVAFRATTLRTDTGTGNQVTRDGIFVADGNGIRRLVGTRDASPGGDPFFRLRDPVLTDLPSVVFRASLGADKETGAGVFVADADGTIHQVALEKDDLGAGITLSRVTSEPAAAPSGDLAFVATRSRGVSTDVQKSLGASILHGSAGRLGLVIAQDMPGPAGGTFRNLSAPAINDLGHVAFRGSFLPFTGGISGVFLATEDGLEPYLTVGETTPAGGHFSAFSNRVTLNAHDDVAFTATVARGSSRTGVFVASRTRLEVHRLALRLGGHGKHDRIRVHLALRLGHLSNGIARTDEPVTVTVSDAHGELWSVTVNPAIFKRQGKALIATPRRRSSLSHQLTGLRLQVGRDGTAFVTASSAALGLTQGGSRPLQPPLAVALQVGDDAGSRTLSCLPGRRGGRCRNV